MSCANNIKYDLHLKLLIPLSLFLLLQLISNDKTTRASAQILHSPRVTNWGKWGKWATCPPEMVVTGLICQVEGAQGRGVSGGNDDTALNSIGLKCSYMDEAESADKEKAWLFSRNGSKGAWRTLESCPRGTYVYGFSLRSEESQGPGENDDTGANDIKLFCRHPWTKEQSSETLWGNGLSWGDWSVSLLCPFGRGICGFRTQVEPYIRGGVHDNTGLNNVDMKCCPNSKIRCLSCNNGK